MLEVASKVASSPSAVLITGESGTGKGLLAETIHALSPRRDGPFIKVHCAALPPTLLESELFGHVRGAFTGADRDRVGRFQQSDGGTLFLDEIGDISLDVQIKLLRVLQEKAFEQVGSSRTVTVDVRILAATNQDLPHLIRAGKFREDLFYRLNVIPIRTATLRERKSDIYELAHQFLRMHARRAGKNIVHIDDSAMETLTSYDWPGNVRELENVIEGSVVLADDGTLSLEDLPLDLLQAQSVPGGGSTFGTRRRATIAAKASSGKTSHPDWGTADSDDDSDGYRRQLIDAIRKARGNKSEAARLLGVPRSTLFSQMKKHGLV